MLMFVDRALLQAKGLIHDVMSCQSFTARRGPVVHLADLAKGGCEINKSFIMLRSLKKQRIFPYKIWSRKKLSRNNREWQHVKNEKYLIVSYLTQKSQYGLQCDVLVFSWQSCYLLIYWKLELAASKNCSL